MRVDVTMLVCACTVAGLKSARGRPGAAVHAKHAKHPGNSSCASCARVRARMRAHHGTLSFRLRQPGVLHRAVLAGPRRAAPRRPGWTDAAVAGLQTARGRPCAAAHCPLLDSPAVPDERRARGLTVPWFDRSIKKDKENGGKTCKQLAPNIENRA